jgi:hypothetical protein
MFKRMFQFSANETETEEILTSRTSRNGSTSHPSNVVKLSNGLQRECEKAANAAAGIKAPGKSYSILKVTEMLNSKHLADMTPGLKRNSLMMALEAASAEIGDLLQDAVTRNRALDEYEEKRREEVKSFEAVKADENHKLHVELEPWTSQYMSRIQANADQAAQEQDSFRAWQKRKQQESQRITDAATFYVPQGNSSNGNANSLTVLERVSVPRR